MIDCNNVFSYEISLRKTKMNSLTQNAMPGSDNFQFFLGFSHLTLFMNTVTAIMDLMHTLYDIT